MANVFLDKDTLVLVNRLAYFLQGQLRGAKYLTDNEALALAKDILMFLVTPPEKVKVRRKAQP